VGLLNVAPTLRAVVLAVLWSAVVVPAPSQRGQFNEREVQAVFLFNFAQFVDWPAVAFSSSDAPIVIGVLGSDPFGPLLDQVVQGEVVRGRTLNVVRFRRVEDIKSCHVLFVSASETERYEQIVDALRAKPTLTVGETANFSSRGMVRFLTEQNRVRLEVNVDAARAAGLTISSNLLRAARIVGTRG
jgi:hypothetical protein